MDQPPIKLVVLDIDGTTLNSQHKLSERNATAIKTLVDEGIRVVIATGRTAHSGRYILDQLKLTLYGIWMQGLVIHDENGDTRYQRTLDPAALRHAITYAEDRGFAVVAYSGDRLMIRSVNQQVADGLAVYHEPIPEPVGPLQNLIDSIPINKIMMFGDPKALKGLRWQLNAQLNGAVRLFQSGVPHMLEMAPPGTSKGTALLTLLQELDIPAEQVMAVGDAENDIEMLQVAGLAVAIGNAEPRVKEIADHVTATNDEDGVAQAIEDYVLRRKLDEPAAAPADTAESATAHEDDAPDENTVALTDNPADEADATPEPVAAATADSPWREPEAVTDKDTDESDERKAGPANESPWREPDADAGDDATEKPAAAVVPPWEDQPDTDEAQPKEDQS